MINSMYNMKTDVGRVTYPETFAQKIRKLFNFDASLYTKALDQVTSIHRCLSSLQ